MTRGERYEELIAGLDFEDPGATPHVTKVLKYLLIEISRYDGNAWVTDYATLAEAAEYRDTQEYPEDWNVEALYDLDTGEKYWPTVKTSWEKVPVTTGKDV